MQGGRLMGALPFRAGAFSGLLGCVVGLSMVTGEASAYTPEQQQACTDDAMRLCGAFVPDVDRITACMIQNKSQLTPRCAVYFQPPPQPAGMMPVRARKPQNVKPRPVNAAQAKPRRPAPKAAARADR